ncbi:uncharacterized protein [Palaemon carinicauda]|uniref:uncharacterized protein isoform X1 n=1 Tax=Palaemon carinicauda TaxID=392227 RepID=UPI0035B65891
MLSLQCDVNTSESLQKLRCKNELCDVVIVSNDGRQTLAHSCILACHSSVLAAVLQSRLTAEHDWSILRPLIINIGEVSVKNSGIEESEGTINIIEILISLMYGETVEVADVYVPALNEYAHVLGLSDQIFTCLDGTAGKNTKDIQIEKNISEECGPPVLDSCHKSNGNEYEHVEVLSEINLDNQIFPASLSKSPQVKQIVDDSVKDSYEGKDNPENVLSFSMLCSEGQEDDDSCGKAWHDGHISYEKQEDIQSQNCNIVVCKMDQSDTEKSSREEIKIEESAILNITMGEELHPNSFNSDGQHLHQQKRHAKKSFICSFCNSAFHKCGDLVKHVQSMQHFTVQCPVCFIQIKDFEGQRLHFALHDQKLPFICVYCELRFRTRAALTMHTPKHMTMKPDNTEKSLDEFGLNKPVSYQVVDGGTQRSKRMLIDSNGYTYTVKRHKGNHTYWCCALRTKYKRCRATVSQTGDDFKVGGLDHCHDVKQGNVASRILSHKIKQEACKDFSAPASTIVDKVVSQCIDIDKPDYDTLFHNNLIRKANRVRQKMKQDTSSSLDFELNEDFMPSAFMKRDLILGNERHLILATNHQIELMSQAKIWYIDGNPDVQCQPFMKCFSIQTYVSSEDGLTLVPLVHVMMSRSKEKDYKEVFSAILDLLPNSPKVNAISADFDKSLWQALICMFPDITPYGCAFKWGKLMWKKAQKLGIKIESLQEDGWQQNLISKLVALPFLPSEHIESAYSTLCGMVKNHRKFEPLLEFIGNTWISSSLWPVSSWTNFMRPVRTSKDVEGWCHRLNLQLNEVNPIFYNIVWLLLKESESIPLDAKCVTEDKLKKHHKKEVTGIRGQIFNLWDTYQNGDMSSSIFLKKCGALYFSEITT